MTLATLEAAIHFELTRTPHSTITHRAHTRYGTVYGYARQAQRSLRYGIGCV